MRNNRFVLPFVLPVFSFVAAIAVGSVLLWFDGNSGSYWDALFIATSSVCVTGLSTVDTATAYSSTGHWVMLLLMQLGGLGITTYSTLIFFMLSRRVALFDRLAVGQLMNDGSFHLGYFVTRIICVVLGLEICGAALLYLMEPDRIGLFNSLFLAVSSFCNAGFTPWSDNLVGWQQHLGLNLVLMSLIVLGGLGFAVLDECLMNLKVQCRRLAARLAAKPMPEKAPALSYLARLVLRTSFSLIIIGAVLIFLTEYFINQEDYFNPFEVALPALFQSVTSRTAGFNTVNIGKLTDLGLLIILGLMFIGGSSGSCAGGIKTGTFRVLLGIAKASLRGKSQVVVAGKGVSMDIVNRAFMLLLFGIGTVLTGTFALAVTEGGIGVHGSTPFQVLDLFFESVSAFATVGLTTGVTTHLSEPGKVIVCILMFVGRLGPIWLITGIQQFQRDNAYRLPEKDLPIG